MGINRVNAARMIAGELRQGREMTDAIVQAAINAHMVTKNPPRKIVDAIKEEAEKLARGTSSLEVTEMIVQAQAKPGRAEGAVRRARHRLYKAGTKWGRSPRETVYILKDSAPVTPPKGYVRVKGCRCKLPTATGVMEEYTRSTLKGSGTSRWESVPVFAYGGVGWFRARLDGYSEQYEAHDRGTKGYGRVEAMVSFHFTEGAGGPGGKPYYTAMELIDWRLDKQGRKMPLDPEEYYYTTEKKPCVRPQVTVFRATGNDAQKVCDEMVERMMKHLRGKPLATAPLPLYRYKGYDTKLKQGGRSKA